MAQIFAPLSVIEHDPSFPESSEYLADHRHHEQPALIGDTLPIAPRFPFLSGNLTICCIKLGLAFALRTASLQSDFSPDIAASNPA